MANKDSLQRTLLVAVLLCIVCSVVVSVAAVSLRPMQKANQELDFKRNILSAAGLFEEGKSVDELFEQVHVRIVDLETGTFTDAVDPDSYDQREAASDPALSESIPVSEDIAKIKRREQYAEIYLVEDDAGIDTFILPIHGYGLWSTLYGFIALEADGNTVKGLVFYEHGETPGLGGEVDNPRWRALWPGKKVYDDSGNVALEVIKGTVDAGAPGAEHDVDGLAGATLTSKGVSNLVHYWLSEDGYQPFLNNLASRQ